MREWISGRNPVFEVLMARRRHSFRLRLAKGLQMDNRLEQIKNMADDQRLKIEYVERGVLDERNANSQGLALETSIYPYAAFSDMLAYTKTQGEAPFFLLLDTVQDPQNLGTLLRTAEAMRVHGIILPIAHTALITPAVVNASSGASEHLLIGQYNLAQAIKELKTNDVWVIGLDEDERSQSPDQIDLNMGIAIVVGNEGQGLRKLVAKSCDHLMKLPMLGRIGSLNAAVAGSIAVYLARQARS